ncbi:fungal-specific transcription factor domain-containing protein [Trichoderma sp. TUCIM 5745]
MGEGRVQKSLGRRKACDVCCRRKIRCDANVPKCSACVLHGTSCTWTPGQHAKAPIRKTQDVSQSRRLAEIESRLAALERSIRNNSVPLSTLVEEHGASTPTVTNNWALLTAPTSPIENSDHFALPPIDHVSALVDKYFSDYNQAMPLFYQPQFMRMLGNWYRCPHERNEASWASINVVLALALQHTPSAATTREDQVSSECIKNAQSVLNHLVIRDEDLQGIQVILALVILFLGTTRPQPSCVLIGTAVKLAHRLRLHLQDGLNDTNTELAAQKERLLWITYILDRDISMRTVEPYGLQDHDMEIDAISTTLMGDSAGVLSLPDDPSQTANLFHLRVQLARIQGEMYDLIYSVRARKFSDDQQEAAVEKLTHLLESWRNTIPKGFRIEDLSSCPSDNILSQLLPLYLAYYLCLFTANRLQSRNSSWIERLIAFSDGIRHSDAIAPPSVSSLPAKSDTKLLPTNWPSIVQAARSCMRLHQFVGRSQLSTLPSIVCSFQAALVILIANNLTVREHLLHDHIEDDSQLIEEALVVFETQAVETNDDVKQAAVLSTCQSLNNRSKFAISKFRQNELSVPFAKDLYDLEGFI